MQAALELRVPEYVYLASPYSDPDPFVQEMRYQKAMQVTSILLKNGIYVYSPIVHCHEMSKLYGLPGDAGFWQQFDEAMIRGAEGIFVLRLDGWARSHGVQAEIKLGAVLGKNITYVSPMGDIDVTVKAG